MTKILAFAGSSSPTSINHQLILNITGRISDHTIEVLNLHEFEFPMYSIVKEKEGFPQNVKFLYEKIVEAPALIIAVNEYNSNVSGFFKNIIDWLSRVEKKFLDGKKILLMSTSPGQRGGASALEYCKNQFPRFGGNVVESFSLPLFYENYDSEKEVIVNEVFDLGIIDVVTSFSQQINE
ncbi:NADPH-dependent FMN reductase [Salinimicrobium terrae]|uniref:NADPH-dependent FMN reductase n=1 Tax=Salinimicrobium terrae TaxID=470866 RepID=UPI0003F7D6EF|nr:NAD(P)H-dependent oxidoreductase [Salinimicrobium terrae]